MRALPVTIVALLLLAAAQSASAAQVCAWLEETTEPEDVRNVKLWLQSDSDVSFLYEIAGDGLVRGADKFHAPNSGTFVLHPGEADSPWAFGATLRPPARIDVVVNLHAPTPSVFDPPGPIIASYAFRRDIPAGETRVPPVLAARQCKTLAKP